MIKSPATLWRDTQMAKLRGMGLQYQQIAPLFGVSGCRVSQCLEKRHRLRNVAKKKLAEFKVEQCALEIRAIKQAYDRLSAVEQSANKEQMAAEIDALLLHYRQAMSHVDA